MNPITVVYHAVLFQPLFNLLVGITNVLPSHSVGVAIIIVTGLVRLIIAPSSIHQAKQLAANQQKMTALREQLKKIQEEHKDNQAKKAEATMQLYRQAGINPLSGCLPLLIQLPILIALYRVFLIGLGPENWQYLYSFVGQPATIQTMFVGIELTTPNVFLGILAGIAQFIQMKFLTPSPTPTLNSDDDNAKMMASFQRNMMYIFPVMTVFIAWQLPSALALYWLVSTIFASGQQYWLKKKLNLPLSTPLA